jgi:hypothetical protein
MARQSDNGPGQRILDSPHGRRLQQQFDVRVVGAGVGIWLARCL